MQVQDIQDMTVDANEAVQAREAEIEAAASLLTRVVETLTSGVRAEMIRRSPDHEVALVGVSGWAYVLTPAGLQLRTYSGSRYVDQPATARDVVTARDRIADAVQEAVDGLSEALRRVADATETKAACKRADRYAHLAAEVKVLSGGERT